MKVSVKKSNAISELIEAYTEVKGISSAATNLVLSALAAELQKSTDFMRLINLTVKDSRSKYTLTAEEISRASADAIVTGRRYVGHSRKVASAYKWRPTSQSVTIRAEVKKTVIAFTVEQEKC